MLTKHKRTVVQGLFIRCPAGHPTSNCPMREIRKRPVSERLQRADTMSEPELNRILRQHQLCINCRLRPLQTK